MTILIPVRNDRDALGQALDAVARQTWPADRTEVIVIDGASTDGTIAVAEGWRARLPGFRILDNPHRSAAAGLNLGIGAARGAVVVRVDARTTVAPDYVARAVAALTEYAEAGCVGGGMTVDARDRVGRAYAAITGRAIGSGGAAFRARGATSAWVDTVYLGAWRRAVLVAVGGFDEALVRNQDDELAARLHRFGFRIRLCPEMQSSYRPRQTVGGILKQYFDYGRWKPAALARHPRMTRLRHLAPPALVAVLLASVALYPWSAAAGRVGGGILALWIACVAVAALRSAARRDRDLLATMPAVTAACHFGYGCGFLIGLPGACRVRPRLLPTQVDDEIAVERARLVAEFRRRDETVPAERYDPESARGRRLEEERRAAFTALWRRGGPASALEIGCGARGWLHSLERLGVGRLAAIDLDSRRAARAAAGVAAADVRTGCASALGWPDGSFELVVLSTVLSSVRFPRFRSAIAAEARRVCGGAILCYDLDRPSPRNSAVGPIGIRELRRLFPGWRIRSRRVTLAPPLDRALDRRPVLRSLLAAVPLLRTHRLALLEPRA